MVVVVKNIDGVDVILSGSEVYAFGDWRVLLISMPDLVGGLISKHLIIRKVKSEHWQICSCETEQEAIKKIETLKLSA